MPRTQIHYSFSKDEGAKPVNIVLSKELNDRIESLCNIVEMSKTSLCRYILKRGIAEMEQKLIELANRQKED